MNSDVYGEQFSATVFSVCCNVSLQCSGLLPDVVLSATCGQGGIDFCRARCLACEIKTQTATRCEVRDTCGLIIGC
jgi:hypothetical protein